MRRTIKTTRREALTRLQGKCLSNLWGISLPVRGYVGSSAMDFAHQEPTEGGLIDH